MVASPKVFNVPDWDDPYFGEGHWEGDKETVDYRYDIQGWLDNDYDWHEGHPGKGDTDDIERLDVHVWDESGKETAFSLYGPFEDEWEDFLEEVEDFIEDYVFDEGDYELK
jgi:hypothetical protein